MKNNEEFRKAVFEKAKAYAALKKKKSDSFVKVLAASCIVAATVLTAVYLPISTVIGDRNTAGMTPDYTGLQYSTTGSAQTTVTCESFTTGGASMTEIHGTVATQGPSNVPMENWVIWLKDAGYGTTFMPQRRKTYAVKNAKWNGSENFVSFVRPIICMADFTEEMRESVSLIPTFENIDDGYFDDYVFVYITVNSQYVPASVVCREDENGKVIEIGVVESVNGSDKMASYTLIVHYPKAELSEGEEISVTEKFYA
jgi:hypothetical protein